MNMAPYESQLYLVSAVAVLSVVEELAADPARLLRIEEGGVLLAVAVERSMVSRSRFVVRVFLYLLSQDQKNIDGHCVCEPCERYVV